MCLGILKAFEIYSNLPYRTAMIIAISQIINESEGHTPLYFFSVSTSLHTRACHIPYT